jgi:glycosyltransferase involved in cell wall biosynthesis
MTLPRQTCERTPKISIVTPSFNQADYIEATIDSVLSQNYPNVQYIIIDGGSTDGSAEIIKKYDGHLAYWVSEPDRGQSHAINKGLERATGNILAYLNSDDLYIPGALHAVADAYAKNPQVGLYYGHCRIIDKDGVVTGRKTGAISSYAEVLDLWDVWWGERNFVQPEVFWTRTAFEQIGPFRDDLYYVMDYEYWTRIFRAGFQSKFIDTDLASFRLHDAQKSTRPAETADELLQVIKPLIWEQSGDISAKTKKQLQGKWLYQVQFCPQVALSLQTGETRLVRLARLLAFSLSHPQLFAVAAFRERCIGAFSLLKRRF